jgi:hypothetical protein
MSKMLQNYQFMVDENGLYPADSLKEFVAGPTDLRAALGITEAAADPADGRGIYFNTATGTYLLSS